MSQVVEAVAFACRCLYSVEFTPGVIVVFLLGETCFPTSPRIVSVAPVVVLNVFSSTVASVLACPSSEAVAEASLI